MLARTRQALRRTDALSAQTMAAATRRPGAAAAIQWSSPIARRYATQQTETGARNRSFMGVSHLEIHLRSNDEHN